ncbi:hypothetical protein [Cystobacter ferrugineus]|nr:hypothetical protein [Cystobacter ferrugineus]
MKRSNYNLRLGMVTVLGVLVSGCASGPATLEPTNSASTHGPAVEALNRYVLVIQETPRGLITHDWRPVEEFDLSRPSLQPRAENTSRRILLAIARQRDCHEEFNDCIDTCMNRPLSEDYSHITSVGAKREYCKKGCWQPYRDCEELRNLRPREFSAAAPAIDWLKRHRDEVLAGSIDVIAGVAFIVAFPPGAIIALIPVTVMASSEVVREPSIAAVAP